MKVTASEEYGLRCLLHLARVGPSESLSIQEIARREGLSAAHAVKILRRLRTAGLIRSIRGQKGGYRLCRQPTDLRLSEILSALGDRVDHGCACGRFSGASATCVHVDDCSLRALWGATDRLLQTFFSRWTLSDPLSTECATGGLADRRLDGLQGLLRST